MKLLWFTWKDLTHPHAGGAEVVNEALAKRLVADGHEVVMLTGSYPGAVAEERHANDYQIIRLGNRYTVYWQAFRYYRRHLRDWADLVIDEVNTLPFFASAYVDEPHVLFFHQLCRRIWFYQLPLPFSLVGYLAEPIYLRLLSAYRVITVSDSTKQDLLRYGFRADRIAMISEGTNAPAMKHLPAGYVKAKHPTMLSFGAIRPMKRTLDQLKAFELAKRQIPDLKFWVAGNASEAYGQKFLRAVAASPYASDITFYDRPSHAKKWQLMREAHCFTATSIKEGWCITVTEANTQGTPAVVYDVDGLRDSVRQDQTGLIAQQNNPQALADAVVTLLADPAAYQRLRKAAWQWSKTLTFDKSYQEFKKAIGA